MKNRLPAKKKPNPRNKIEANGTNHTPQNNYPSIAYIRTTRTTHCRSSRLIMTANVLGTGNPTVVANMMAGNPSVPQQNDGDNHADTKPMVVVWDCQYHHPYIHPNKHDVKPCGKRKMMPRHPITYLPQLLACPHKRIGYCLCNKHGLWANAASTVECATDQQQI